MSKIPMGDMVVDVPVHATGYWAGAGPLFNLRLDTDPLYYATITLQNVLDGSRYRVAMHDTPYTELAAGVQSGSGDIEIASVPAYSSPMLVDIVVRKFGVGGKYQQYTTQAVLPKSGVIVYIVQTEDPTA